MTLSVLLGTHQPAPVAAAILAPLREVADEIVLAVDRRVDPDALGAYEDLADRLLLGRVLRQPGVGLEASAVLG